MNEDGCQWNQGSSTQKFLSKSKVVREHVNVSCLLMCVLHISFYVSVVYRIHVPKKKICLPYERIEMVMMVFRWKQCDCFELPGWNSTGVCW